MYQYTNGFTCALGADKNTIMINFRQKAPVFDNDGTLCNTELIQIASVIMDKKMAEELGKALSSAANDFRDNDSARISEISGNNDMEKQ